MVSCVLWTPVRNSHHPPSVVVTPPEIHWPGKKTWSWGRDIVGLKQQWIEVSVTVWRHKIGTWFSTAGPRLLWFRGRGCSNIMSATKGGWGYGPPLVLADNYRLLADKGDSGPQFLDDILDHATKSSTTALWKVWKVKKFQGPIPSLCFDYQVSNYMRGWICEHKNRFSTSFSHFFFSFLFF